MTDDRTEPADGSTPAHPIAGRDGSIAAAIGDPTPPQTGPRVLRVWASAELAVACLAVAVIFVSVLWQVTSRYVPALNWPGVGELGNYSLIVLTFIMVGYLIGNNGHIAIQIIDYVVKGRAMVVVKAVSAACTALICAVLVWEAVELIRAFPTRRTAALEIPIWILYAVPLVGFASGAVRAVVRIFLAGRADAVFDAAEAR